MAKVTLPAELEPATSDGYIGDAAHIKLTDDDRIRKLSEVVIDLDNKFNSKSTISCGGDFAEIITENADYIYSKKISIGDDIVLPITITSIKDTVHDVYVYDNNGRQILSTSYNTINI
jgi:hypothetical protein